MRLETFVDGLREFHNRNGGRRPDGFFVRRSWEWLEALETGGWRVLFAIGRRGRPAEDAERVAQWAERQVGEFEGVPILLAEPEQLALAKVDP